MSPAAYRLAIKAAGLTQARFARMLLVDKGTPSRWATGQAPIPAHVPILLGVLQNGWATIEQLEAQQTR